MEVIYITDINSKAIDALLYVSVEALVQEDLDYFNSIDDSNIIINPKFDNKMYKLLSKKKNDIQSALWIINLKRAAVACLIILSTTFVLSMSIDAVRNEFFGAISNWFDEYVIIHFVSKTDEAVTITKKEPIYVPEGCERKVITDNPFMYSIEYYHDNELLFAYTQQTIKASSAYDAENSEIKEIKINGLPGILFISDIGYTTIYFSDNKYSYTLCGFIDSSELITISESVK